MLKNSSNANVTYELCYDPRDGDVIVYRVIRAGICGPFSESIPCANRAEAERFANSRGYALVGDWASHANYDSAPLALVS